MSGPASALRPPLGVVNTLFTHLVQNVVGNFNLVYDTMIAQGMIGYVIIFALIFWRFGSTGSIGRLLGAKDKGHGGALNPTIRETYKRPNASRMRR